jgi:hypothetical protein
VQRRAIPLRPSSFSSDLLLLLLRLLCYLFNDGKTRRYTRAIKPEQSYFLAAAFFLPATVLRRPLRVRELVRVR